MLSAPQGEPNAAPPKPRAESHVRLRSYTPVRLGADIDYLDAQDLLDELCEDQITLSMSLAALERAAEEGPRDPSARAALRALEAKIVDMRAVRDALAAVQQVAVDRRLHRIFCADAPLSEYLRGIYAWLHGVTRALDTIAVSLNSLTPDWALFRWRLEEAKNFHFDELQGAIRADVAALSIVAQGISGPESLGAAIDRLFAAADALEESLDQRFG